MGASVVVYGKWQNGGILSYGPDTGDGNSTRASIVRRQSPDSFGLWDNNNSWNTSSPTNPTQGQPYRVHCAWNGTTQRELFVSGASAGVDATVT